MAVIHTLKAGQWGKEKSKQYHNLILSSAFILTLILGLTIGFMFGAFHWKIAAILLVIPVGLLYVAVKQYERTIDRWSLERLKYLRGAQAEGLVAWYLKDLPGTWHVFHNLRCAQGGDIDHVVVGTGGLFVISTKSHRGHVTRTASGSARLNGQPMDEMYDEAMRLALWTRDRLKTVLGDQVPWVQPVLCLPHAHSDLPPTEGKVWLLNDQTLMQTLDPEKPKSKVAAKRVELIAAELAKVTC